MAEKGSFQRLHNVMITEMDGEALNLIVLAFDLPLHLFAANNARDVIAICKNSRGIFTDRNVGPFVDLFASFSLRFGFAAWYVELMTFHEKLMKGSSPRLEQYELLKLTRPFVMAFDELYYSLLKDDLESINLMKEVRGMFGHCDSILESLRTLMSSEKFCCTDIGPMVDFLKKYFQMKNVKMPPWVERVEKLSAEVAKNRDELLKWRNGRPLQGDKAVEDAPRELGDLLCVYRGEHRDIFAMFRDRWDYIGSDFRLVGFKIDPEDSLELCLADAIESFRKNSIVIILQKNDDHNGKKDTFQQQRYFGMVRDGVNELVGAEWAFFRVAGSLDVTGSRFQFEPDSLRSELWRRECVSLMGIDYFSSKWNIIESDLSELDVAPLWQSQAFCIAARLVVKRECDGAEKTNQMARVDLCLAVRDNFDECRISDRQSSYESVEHLVKLSARSQDRRNAGARRVADQILSSHSVDQWLFHVFYLVRVVPGDWGDATGKRFENPVDSGFGVWTHIRREQTQRERQPVFIKSHAHVLIAFRELSDGATMRFSVDFLPPLRDNKAEDVTDFWAFNSRYPDRVFELRIRPQLVDFGILGSEATLTFESNSLPRDGSAACVTLHNRFLKKTDKKGEICRKNVSRHVKTGDVEKETLKLELRDDEMAYVKNVLERGGLLSYVEFKFGERKTALCGVPPTAVNWTPYGYTPPPQEVPEFDVVKNYSAHCMNFESYSDMCRTLPLLAVGEQLVTDADFDGKSITVCLPKKQVPSDARMLSPWKILKENTDYKRREILPKLVVTGGSPVTCYVHPCEPASLVFFLSVVLRSPVHAVFLRRVECLRKGVECGGGRATQFRPSILEFVVSNKFDEFDDFKRRLMNSYFTSNVDIWKVRRGIIFPSAVASFPVAFRNWKPRFDSSSWELDIGLGGSGGSAEDFCCGVELEDFAAPVGLVQKQFEQRASKIVLPVTWVGQWTLHVWLQSSLCAAEISVKEWGRPLVESCSVVKFENKGKMVVCLKGKGLGLDKDFSLFTEKRKVKVDSCFSVLALSLKSASTGMDDQQIPRRPSSSSTSEGSAADGGDSEVPSEISLPDDPSFSKKEVQEVFLVDDCGFSELKLDFKRPVSKNALGKLASWAFDNSVSHDLKKGWILRKLVVQFKGTQSKSTLSHGVSLPLLLGHEMARALISRSVFGIREDMGDVREFLRQVCKLPMKRESDLRKLQTDVGRAAILNAVKRQFDKDDQNKLADMAGDLIEIPKGTIKGVLTTERPGSWDGPAQNGVLVLADAGGGKTIMGASQYLDRTDKLEKLAKSREGADLGVVRGVIPVMVLLPRAAAVDEARKFDKKRKALLLEYFESMLVDVLKEQMLQREKLKENEGAESGEMGREEEKVGAGKQATEDGRKLSWIVAIMKDLLENAPQYLWVYLDCADGIPAPSESEGSSTESELEKFLARMTAVSAPAGAAAGAADGAAAGAAAEAPAGSPAGAPDSVRNVARAGSAGGVPNVARDEAPKAARRGKDCFGSLWISSRQIYSVENATNAFLKEYCGKPPVLCALPNFSRLTKGDAKIAKKELLERYWKRKPNINFAKAAEMLCKSDELKAMSSTPLHVRMCCDVLERELANCEAEQEVRSFNFYKFYEQYFDCMAQQALSKIALPPEEAAAAKTEAVRELAKWSEEGPTFPWPPDFNLKVDLRLTAAVLQCGGDQSHYCLNHYSSREFLLGSRLWRDAISDETFETFEESLKAAEDSKKARSMAAARLVKMLVEHWERNLVHATETGKFEMLLSAASSVAGGKLLKEALYGILTYSRAELYGEVKEEREIGAHMTYFMVGKWKNGDTATTTTTKAGRSKARDRYTDLFQRLCRWRLYLPKDDQKEFIRELFEKLKALERERLFWNSPLRIEMLCREPVFSELETKSRLEACEKLIQQISPAEMFKYSERVCELVDFRRRFYRDLRQIALVWNVVAELLFKGDDELVRSVARAMQAVFVEATPVGSAGVIDCACVASFPACECCAGVRNASCRGLECWAGDLMASAVSEMDVATPSDSKDVCGMLKQLLINSAQTVIEWFTTDHWIAFVFILSRVVAFLKRSLSCERLKGFGFQRVCWEWKAAEQLTLLRRELKCKAWRSNVAAPLRKDDRTAVLWFREICENCSHWMNANPEISKEQKCKELKNEACRLVGSYLANEQSSMHPSLCVSWIDSLNMRPKADLNERDELDLCKILAKYEPVDPSITVHWARHVTDSPIPQSLGHPSRGVLSKIFGDGNPECSSGYPSRIQCLLVPHLSESCLTMDELKKLSRRNLCSAAGCLLLQAVLRVWLKKFEPSPDGSPGAGCSVGECAGQIRALLDLHKKICLTNIEQRDKWCVELYLQIACGLAWVCCALKIRCQRLCRAYEGQTVLQHMAEGLQQSCSQRTLDKFVADCTTCLATLVGFAADYRNDLLHVQKARLHVLGNAIELLCCMIVGFGVSEKKCRSAARSSEAMANGDASGFGLPVADALRLFGGFGAPCFGDELNGLARSSTAAIFDFVFVQRARFFGACEVESRIFFDEVVGGIFECISSVLESNVESEDRKFVCTSELFGLMRLLWELRYVVFTIMWSKDPEMWFPNCVKVLKLRECAMMMPSELRVGAVRRLLQVFNWNLYIQGNFRERTKNVHNQNGKFIVDCVSAVLQLLVQDDAAQRVSCTKFGFTARAAEAEDFGVGDIAELRMFDAQAPLKGLKAFLSRYSDQVGFASIVGCCMLRCASAKAHWLSDNTQMCPFSVNGRCSESFSTYKELFFHIEEEHEADAEMQSEAKRQIRNSDRIMSVWSLSLRHRLYDLWALRVGRLMYEVDDNLSCLYALPMSYAVLVGGNEKKTIRQPRAEFGCLEFSDHVFGLLKESISPEKGPKKIDTSEKGLGLKYLFEQKLPVMKVLRDEATGRGRPLAGRAGFGKCACWTLTLDMIALSGGKSSASSLSTFLQNVLDKWRERLVLKVNALASLALARDRFLLDKEFLHRPGVSVDKVFGPEKGVKITPTVEQRALDSTLLRLVENDYNGVRVDENGSSERIQLWRDHWMSSWSFPQARRFFRVYNAMQFSRKGYSSRAARDSYEMLVFKETDDNKVWLYCSDWTIPSSAVFQEGYWKPFAVIGDRTVKGGGGSRQKSPPSPTKETRKEESKDTALPKERFEKIKRAAVPAQPINHFERLCSMSVTNSEDPLVWAQLLGWLCTVATSGIFWGYSEQARLELAGGTASAASSSSGFEIAEVERITVKVIDSNVKCLNTWTNILCDERVTGKDSTRQAPQFSAPCAVWGLRKICAVACGVARLSWLHGRTDVGLTLEKVRAAEECLVKYGKEHNMESRESESQRKCPVMNYYISAALREVRELLACGFSSQNLSAVGKYDERMIGTSVFRFTEGLDGLVTGFRNPQDFGPPACQSSSNKKPAWLTGESCRAISALPFLLSNNVRIPALLMFMLQTEEENVELLARVLGYSIVNSVIDNGWLPKDRPANAEVGTNIGDFFRRFNSQASCVLRLAAGVHGVEYPSIENLAVYARLMYPSDLRRSTQDIEEADDLLYSHILRGRLTPWKDADFPLLDGLHKMKCMNSLGMLRGLQKRMEEKEFYVVLSAWCSHWESPGAEDTAEQPSKRLVRWAVKCVGGRTQYSAWEPCFLFFLSNCAGGGRVLEEEMPEDDMPEEERLEGERLEGEMPEEERLEEEMLEEERLEEEMLEEERLEEEMPEEEMLDEERLEEEMLEEERLEEERLEEERLKEEMPEEEMPEEERLEEERLEEERLEEERLEEERLEEERLEEERLEEERLGEERLEEEMPEEELLEEERLEEERLEEVRLEEEPELNPLRCVRLLTSEESCMIADHSNVLEYLRAPVYDKVLSEDAPVSAQLCILAAAASQGIDAPRRMEGYVDALESFYRFCSQVAPRDAELFEEAEEISEDVPRMLRLPMSEDQVLEMLRREIPQIVRQFVGVRQRKPANDTFGEDIGAEGADSVGHTRQGWESLLYPSLQLQLRYFVRLFEQFSTKRKPIESPETYEAERPFDIGSLKLWATTLENSTTLEAFTRNAQASVDTAVDLDLLCQLLMQLRVFSPVVLPDASKAGGAPLQFSADQNARIVFKTLSEFNDKKRKTERECASRVLRSFGRACVKRTRIGNEENEKGSG